MRRVTFAVVGIAVLAVVVGVLIQVRHGVSARDEPTALEAFVARRLRALSIPRNARRTTNPVEPSPEVLVDARAHFADHCAVCHANDGSGQTAIGENLYPKAPDMRDEATQRLTDGELFYIIHNGIRLTGMPAWGDEPAEDDVDSWKLVHFIRRLPHLTGEDLAEMRRLDPTSAHDREEEEEIRRFLQGEPSPAGDHAPHRH